MSATPSTTPTEAHEAHPKQVRTGLLLAGIVLVALNLRGSIVGAGPLLKDIQQSTGLSASVLGLLVTLPLLGFGLVSPVAPWLSRVFGIERLLLASLAILTLGTLFRSMPDAWIPFLPEHTALFLGTALIGCCIAVGNVVVPSLIRRDLPSRAGPVTSVFVATFAGIGAVAAAIAVPLEHWLGWRGSLACWAVPALIGVLVWVPLSRGRGGMSVAHREAASAVAVNVWRSALAWMVTGFMGLQSLAFYVLVAWLPSLLRESGQSASDAGILTSIFQAACLTGGLVSPILVARVRDQRAYAVGASLVTLAGFVLLMISPALPLAGLLAGFGCGSSLGVAIVMFSARSANSHDTGALSGMAQSVGYLLAACGPVLFGLLRDATHSWNIPLAVATAFVGVQAIVGFVAGKPGIMTTAGVAADQPMIS